MGKEWYEDLGKYLTKLNTFHDFIDCGQFLVDQQITQPDKLAIVGRSAGGLLIGAVCNMKPSLFKAAVADVPFVDALNTMSDPTIPLTVTEWEEWGKCLPPIFLTERSALSNFIFLPCTLAFLQRFR
jgi:oligopeptidase B